MERARHRKAKSASGIDGIRQIQKQKAVSRLSSDSRAYIDGSTRDDMPQPFMLELGQSSLREVSGTPMKKLLALEMSKEVDSKRRSPSVIARLMGLEGLPSPRHVPRQQKRLSESYQQKNVSINTTQRINQLYDVRSTSGNPMEQLEFKDVYEDLEASHIVNRRCSSRWSASSMLSKPEMVLIQQKFMDAKRLSADEKFQQSKELDDSLGMLDTSKALLLKLLQQPDSLFVKHLHDLKVDPSSSLHSHIAVLRPSDSAKYDGNARAWKSERDSSTNHGISSHLKREDGLLLDPQNRHRARISCKSSNIQLEEKNEKRILPTRIVVLKPNLGKVQNADTPLSSPDHLHDYLPNFRKLNDDPKFEGAETVSCRRKDSSYNVGLTKSKSKEAREKSREIARRMKDDRGGTMNSMSSGVRGYTGDESSCEAFEIDSDSESEVFKMSSGNSFDNRCIYPSSILVESLVNREAKKRLSERWKMTHRYQDVEIAGKESTLGEMLATRNKETRPKHLNVKTSVDKASDELGTNNGTAMLDGPVGISSRDGWKGKTNKTSARSSSLPPSIGGRSQRRSTYHDALPEDKNLMHSDTVNRARSKVAKANLSQKEDISSKYSKSRSKKSLPRRHRFINEIVSASEANFEIQMEANIKDLSEQQPIFQMASKAETSTSPVSDAMKTAEQGSIILFPKLSELLPNHAPPFVDNDNSAACCQEDSILQEPLKGSPEQGSPLLQCLGTEPDSSESSKEADHPSPVSVLEIPFTEDTTSASESFERVSAELHDLRMQLQLLKMESGAYAEEEVAQQSPMGFEGNYMLEVDDDWQDSYVLDVLINSGFEDCGLDMFRTTWHSPECPLDPGLFDNLEKKYSNDSTGLKCERMLLFDRINWALFEIFQQHVDVCPWLMPKIVGLHSDWQKEEVRDAFEMLIRQDFANGELSERVLDREMQWLDSKEEIDIIGNEIEKLLIDDMIIDVLCN